jgi:hypothetical protein
VCESDRMISMSVGSGDACDWVRVIWWPSVSVGLNNWSGTLNQAHTQLSISGIVYISKN